MELLVGYDGALCVGFIWFQGIKATNQNEMKKPVTQWQRQADELGTET